MNTESWGEIVFHLGGGAANGIIMLLPFFFCKARSSFYVCAPVLLPLPEFPLDLRLRLGGRRRVSAVALSLVLNRMSAGLHCPAFP